ncbi:MAG: rod shape-determining protein MreD [Calditrichia bacterium]|jgi:rod shape-determining protein MreD
MTHDRKTNIIYIVIIGLVALLLQAFFVPIIEIGVWRPDVVLLGVLYIGYRYGIIAGILSGFILGILQDSMSPLPLGITSLANSVIGFAAGQIRQFKLAYNARILASVILILLQGCIFYFFYQLRAETTFGYLLLTRVFPNTIYTFLIGLLISFFISSKTEKI